MNVSTLATLLLIVFLPLLLPQLWNALRFLWVNRPGAHQQRTIAAATRGWEYRRGRIARPLLYSLSGQSKEGVAWELQAFRQRATARGSTARGFAYTCWIAQRERLAEGSELLIAPRLPEMARFLLPFYGTQFMLGGILQADARHLVALPEVAAGSDVVRQRYTIRASSEGIADQLVTATLESLLLDWPFQPKNLWYAPIIMMNKDGLQIQVLAAVYDLPTLDYLVSLGQALISAHQTR